MDLKKILFTVLVGIWLVGCSPKNIEVPEAKDYTKTLKTAWEAYNNFDFSVAILKFDTVINYEVSSPSALLGLGWSYGQIGEMDKAVSYLNLTITSVTNDPPIKPVFKWHPEATNIKLVHPVFDTTLTLVEVRVPENYRPFVGLLKFAIVGDMRDWQLYYFTDTSFSVLPEYFDSASEFPGIFDSLYVDFLIPNLSDSVCEYILDAYAGLASAYSATENYLNSIAAALAVTRLKSDYSLGFYPHTTAREILINLASDYLNYGLNYNAVELLKQLDSSWSFDYTKINPYSAEGVETILKEIMRLQGM